MKNINYKDKLNILRILREKECFSIINRGKLWYDCLSEEQIFELRKWYRDWLNVTETEIIPIRPDWLNKKLSEEEITW